LCKNVKELDLIMPQNKVFVNVSSAAVKANLETFRKLLGQKTKIFAVVKSNAYGHGLVAFSKLADRYGAAGFCVDSVVEGEKLRKEGIKKPILVLGPTFKHQLEAAAKNKLTITLSGFEALEELAKSRHKPDFHLKIDTGMHRQGFYLGDLPKTIRQLKQGLPVTGAYTHFASAKELNYPTITEIQFKEFQKAVKMLEAAGFKNLLKHAAATGGTLLNPKYHLDAVRIGIGLYGLWPSGELMVQLPKIRLKPVLSWRAIVSEVKKLNPGDYVGYDLTERMERPSKMAVIPIGYWHGYPRALSSIGEVVIDGKKARVLGRVSMDMITVDVTGIKCERGSKATLIGRQSGAEVNVYDLSRKLGASHYELITRINPLIERVVV